MIRPKASRLSLTQRNHVLQEEDPVEDPELSRKLLGKVFLLRDGAALLVSGRRTQYVESAEELRQMIAESERERLRGPR